MGIEGLLIRGALAALVVATIWAGIHDWLSTRDELAAAKTAQAQVVQAFTDSTRAKDEALRRLQQDADLSHAAVAAADQAARRANQRAQQLQADLRQLAAQDASVAVYLGTRIPPALLDRLRQRPTAADRVQDGNDRAPAGSEPAEPDPDASTGR